MLRKKITPFLWFDDQAEEAARFYVSVFKKSNLGNIARYPHLKGAPGKPGSVMTVDFTIEGQPFIALNAGPAFKFNESISFVVDCKTQAEVDYYWKKLTANGGQESACGWLKDKFGVSWQITPTVLLDYVTGKDKKKAERAMTAMMTMRKIDIQKIKQAAQA